MLWKAIFFDQRLGLTDSLIRPWSSLWPLSRYSIELYSCLLSVKVSTRNFTAIFDCLPFARISGYFPFVSMDVSFTNAAFNSFMLPIAVHRYIYQCVPLRSLYPTSVGLYKYIKRYCNSTRSQSIWRRTLFRAIFSDVCTPIIILILRAAFNIFTRVVIFA